MPRFSPHFFPSTKVSEWASGVVTANPGLAPFAATGGTETTHGIYKVHSFTSTGQFTVTSGSADVAVLIVAGGGGGGGSKNNYRSDGGDGAGAGGVSMGGRGVGAGATGVGAGAGGDG